MKLAPTAVRGRVPSARTMTLFPHDNGPILSLVQIINVVMSSSSEAELAGLFITSKAIVPLRHTLKEIKYPQPRSPIHTYNSTENGFPNQTIVPKKTK